MSAIAGLPARPAKGPSPDEIRRYQQRTAELRERLAHLPTVANGEETELDAILRLREQLVPGPAVACATVLVSQGKKTPCWSIEQVEAKPELVKRKPGLYYIANTLHRIDRKSDSSRPWLDGSCTRNNQTRFFPDQTRFVFVDLETHDADWNRVEPTIEECEALVHYCHERGATACGLSPHGIHPLLVFDRPVRVADPDEAREMERAVRWFFRDFFFGRWFLDPCSWTRSRHERACPLLYLDEARIVPLPKEFPPVHELRAKQPAAPKKQGPESTAPPAVGKASVQSLTDPTSTIGLVETPRVNFLGQLFRGSHAEQRAIESNVCLCRLANMSTEETAQFTGRSVREVKQTWHDLEGKLAPLPASHAAAVRSKILRGGQPLVTKDPAGSRTRGLPPHWVEAPRKWFDPGEAFVTSSSSWPRRVSEEYFARSFGHSVQIFGDAGFTPESAHQLILLWLAMVDLGFGPHEAMKELREQFSSQAGVSKEEKDRIRRCLNSRVSWRLYYLLVPLRNDFASRHSFSSFLLAELKALAEKYWGKRRKLRPISDFACYVVERGVVKFLARKPGRPIVRTKEVIDHVEWDSLPPKKRWDTPPNILPGCNVIIPFEHSNSAKSAKVRRYFKVRHYRNDERTQGRWRVPKDIRHLADEFMKSEAFQPPEVTSILEHTLTDRGGGGGGVEREGVTSIVGSGGLETANPPITTTTCIGGELPAENPLAGFRGKLRIVDLVDGLDPILPPLRPEKLSSGIWDAHLEVVVDRLEKACQGLDKGVADRLNETCRRLRGIEDRAVAIEEATGKPANERDALPPALQAVRAALAEDGHIYQPRARVMQVLRALCRHEPGPSIEKRLWKELLESGLVVNVSRFVSDGVRWYAWRRRLEGEAAFARNVLDHAKRGGKAEVLFGDPGTGKTEQVAKRVARAKKSQPNIRIAIGSAQNNSALVLQNRIIKFEVQQTVDTIHKAYNVRVDNEVFSKSINTARLHVADEVGQIDTYTAGAMSCRWHSRQPRPRPAITESCPRDCRCSGHQSRRQYYDRVVRFGRGR